MSKVLDGKVAIITGGSRGLGAVLAATLADQGADIAITYAASADKADDNTPDVVDITARFHRVFRTESRYGEEVFSDTPGTPGLMP